MGLLVHPALLRTAAVAALVLSAHAAAADTKLVRAGDDLQAALNAAQPGDTLLLQAGATFTGNFVLPVKGGGTFITVRSATPDGELPGPSSRINPSHAPKLARIRSGNAMSALKTAAGSHHWRLLFLEFSANTDGVGDIIQLGDGSSKQNQAAQVPYEIELDRLYIHGDALTGQKRGIALNARSVTIRNSYIAEIKAVGMDTQAIGGWNGPGPFVIENNYLEAAGENFMLGGADPSIPQLVSDNVIIRSNHFSRPLSWRDPVVATPQNVSIQAQAGGSLSGGLFQYRVVARRPAGGGVTARSAASTVAGITLNAPAAARLTWSAVPGASDYQVYRRDPAGTSQFWTVTAPAFTDTGAAGKSGSAPSSAGSSWTVKNLLELKNARNVTIERNLFENHWAGAQAGYAIVLTPRNQDGTCTWCVVEDVTFQFNVVRNCAAGFNILGYDDLAPSRQTRRLRIAHNVFQLTTAMGGNAWFMLIGNGPSDVTVDHNTIDANGTTLTYVYSAAYKTVARMQFTNNAARHSNYGMNGADAAFGNGVIAAYFPDGVVRGNWLQGAHPSRYPDGNYYDGTFATAFVDAAKGNYAAAPGGPLARRATDGTDIGANFADLVSAVDKITQGSSATPPPAPGNLRFIK